MANQIIKIGEVDKDFKYIGDLNGVDLIIRSDNKDFYGFGGAIWIYFSIENISGKDQFVKTLLAFSNHKKEKFQEVKRFIGNNQVEKEIVEDVSVYPESIRYEKVRKIISEPIYELKTITSKDGIENPEITPKRKGLHNRTHQQQFIDLIKNGEVAYYKVKIEYPVSIQNDEFIIESFGSEGGYGYLDPNLWTYTQNFNTLNTASLDGQDSWVIAAGTITVQGSGGADGGSPDKYALAGQSGVVTTANRTITSIASGTFYISMQRNNTSATAGVFYAFEDAVLPFEIDFSSGNISIAGTNIGTYSTNTWYKIGVQFETGSGAWQGLAADTFKANINDGAWSAAINFRNAVAGVNKLRMYDHDGAGSDTCSYDWIFPAAEAAAAFIPKIMIF